MAKKKEEEGKESRADAFMQSQLMTNLQKKYGVGVVQTGAKFKYQFVPRIPTGVLSVDLALGGGLPAGRVSTFYGMKSTSKTTTFLKAVGEAHKMCANCFAYKDVCKCGAFRDFLVAYLDVEGCLDLAWCRTLGVDLSRFLVSQPESGEQTLDMAEAFIRSGDVDVVVIDSVAFLTPAKEIEESVEKVTMGQQAAMVGKGIRKSNAGLSAVFQESGRRPSLWLTNQIRFKVGLVFGSPISLPGGQAPQFASSVEVQMLTPKYRWLGEKDESEEENEGKKKKDSGEVDKGAEGIPPYCVDFRFRVEKNKTARPHIEDGYRLLLEDHNGKKKGDVVDEPIIFRGLQRFGLAEQRGNTWHLGWTETKFTGKGKFLDALRENVDLKAEAVEQLKRAVIREQSSVSSG